jgi:hypothetical protein
MDSVTVVSHTQDVWLTGLRTRQQAFAAHFDLSLDQYLKIVKSCNSVEAITVLELLKAAKFRSAYRESCAAKVRKWLTLDSVAKPLAPWEFARCAPTWRVTYSLPTF